MQTDTSERPYSADGVTKHPSGHKLSTNSTKQGQETAVTKYKVSLVYSLWPHKSFKDEY